ncbi:transglutaminase-like cysteine peptidase [Methylocystis suflitae]|uniref:transglutaminase-like cysteine peptidase n=1 Tax=Methylocystis suflitae TaxID=2951405 RepID=UPI0021088B5D|nr:transglutaminase-like cysteine peptidase [Methylocystis suflitae]MCQ4188720.1 transglutaminase-like cysteine peptidase [Methylocystis suflitae]
MLGIVSKAVVALGMACAALVVVNAKSFAGPETATFAVLGPETSVPYGWVDFCQRYRGECQNEETAPQDVELTAAVFRKIARINAWVNENIDPIADVDHWSAVDQWDYPSDGKGDCEDFALLKRRMLIEEGFPRQALLLTVVKEKNGDGHSVLTVKTDRGEFVLDNLSNEMRPWTRVPYRFVKRQSQQNQNAWVAISPATSAPLYVSR